MYIGTSIALGIFLINALPANHKLWGRRISQLLVGLYMLGYVGFVLNENMQLEGFFFYLFGGIFAGATLHYFLAKIVGTAIVNRGWCSWACWTAMVLDFLPWKKSPGRIKRAGIFRYIHFLVSFLLVVFFWFVLNCRNIYDHAITELIWLATGNAVYYAAAVSMAFIVKDNRAFCKYACPIPTTQKLFSRFALIKIEIDSEKCIDCRLCEKNCPMDIKILEYKNQNNRIISTECILCNTCGTVCPKDAINFTIKCDVGGLKENLIFR